MPRNKSRDPIPESFSTLEQAAEFWDHHDLADYDHQTSAVSAEVKIERRTFLTALEPELAKKVSTYAGRQGVAAETLINVWLSEKLAAATAKK
jgi:hypothetical protein